jgi:hypothetical protein
VALLFRRGVWFASAYMAAIDATLRAGWRFQDDLHYWPQCVSRTLAAPDVFPTTDEDAGDMVVGILLNGAPETAQHLDRLEDLLKGGALSRRQQERFEFAVANELPLEVIAQSSVDPGRYIDRVVSELKSHTWPRQNLAADIIANLGPTGLGRVSLAHQFRIGNNVLQAGDGTAHSAGVLLRRLAVVDSVWPAAFIEGIVAECFVNDEKTLRFKTRLLGTAAKSWRAIPPSERPAASQRLANLITSAVPSAKMGQAPERDAAAAVIDGLIANDASFDTLQPVVDALRKHRLP